MIKIYTYGCSFTAGYEELMFSEYTWQNHLKLSCNYEPVNRGHGGGGFYDVRKYVLQDIGVFTNDDIVIIQLPTPNRVVIPYFQTQWDSFMRIRHEHSSDTIGWLKYLKDRDGLRYELAKEAELIFDLLCRLNIKWYWWTAEQPDNLLIDKFSDKMLTIENQICYEDWIWKNQQFWRNPNDWHQSKQGHLAIANSFSHQISCFM